MKGKISDFICFSPIGQVLKSTSPSLRFIKKHFGKEKNHLQLGFLNGGGKQINCIAFFKEADHFEKDIVKGAKVNLVAHVEKSLFRGFPELRLRIVDIY